MSYPVMTNDNALAAPRMSPYEMWTAGLTTNTLRAYSSDVTSFCIFAGIDRDRIHTLTADALFSWATKWLSSQGASSATLARRASSLRSYADFLAGLRFIENNPLKYLRTGKVRNKTKDALSIDDVNQILGAVDRSTDSGRRDYLALLLLRELGLRRHELTSLTFGSFSKGASGRTIVRFVAKGGSEDVMPVSESAAAALRDCSGAVIDPSRPVFLNRWGTRLSDTSIYNLVQHYADKAGIAKEITPHSFRHHAITDALRVEPSVLKAKGFSRHRHVATMDRYNQLDKIQTIADIQAKRGLI